MLSLQSPYILLIIDRNMLKRILLKKVINYLSASGTGNHFSTEDGDTELLQEAVGTVETTAATHKVTETSFPMKISRSEICRLSQRLGSPARACKICCDW